MASTGAALAQVLSRAFQLFKGEERWESRGEENEDRLTLGRLSLTYLGEDFVQTSLLLV